MGPRPEVQDLEMQQKSKSYYSKPETLSAPWTITKDHHVITKYHSLLIDARDTQQISHTETGGKEGLNELISNDRVSREREKE